MNIGELIRKLRKERKLTLFELSNKSGVALATLSRMENGRMTGTLNSHMNICRALEVALPDLYRDLVAADRIVEVQSEKARADVSIHDNTATLEMLAANSLSKKMMPMMIKISKGGQARAAETKIGIEKFIYVLDGKVEAYIGKEKYDLNKGDTLYFESSVAHHFKNPGELEARLISVVSPPTL